MAMTAGIGSRRDERAREVSTVGKLLQRPELGAVAGTTLVFLFFAIVAGDKGMFSPKGILNFLDVSAQLGIIAVAAALLMIGGEFDLSVGSMIAFAGICIAIPATEWGWPIGWCILFSFAVALAIGWINGMLVVRTGLPSFIVTLGGLFILRGLTIGITRPLTGRTQIPGLSGPAQEDWLAPWFGGQAFTGTFAWLAEAGWIAKLPNGAASVTGISMSILWWLLLVVLATWVLMRIRFGNWIFASGGDKHAARNVGVPVDRVKITLFMFTALCAAIFAACQVMTFGSADTQRSPLKEFEAIIAVVIGGTLLTGGYGSAVGSAFGALIFGVVQMGIFYTGVDTNWFKVFVGAMVLISAMFNNHIRKKVTESR